MLNRIFAEHVRQGGVNVLPQRASPVPGKLNGPLNITCRFPIRSTFFPCIGIPTVCCVEGALRICRRDYG